MTRVGFVLLALAFILLPGVSHAQDQSVEQDYLEKAQVLDASASQTEVLPGAGITAQVQQLQIKVLDGPDKGTLASFANNYTQVATGDLIYVRHTTGGDGPDMWSLSDPYRLNVLLDLFLVFLVLAFLIGGWQGLRGLATLAGSIGLIFAVLLPGIYAGYSPVLVSITVAGLIIVVGSYITHGFNRTTSVAVLGMLATVLITGLAAFYVVHAAHLSGFTSEENAYLNFDTAGKIDMVGLLFGGIMIGLLGVLYDIAIGQAIAVEELLRAARDMTRRRAFLRGMRIGREHIGALINTLAIAYVGTSLPLLLLFHDSSTSIGYLVNSELFATEIVRILIGSIGLILAVPITTVIACSMLHGRELEKTSGTTHQH